MYLGVDIGGTAVKIGLVDLDGNLICEDSYSVNFDNYNTPILESVKNSIKKFSIKNSIDIFRLNGIGVSATGQINVKSGKVVGTAGHIKNWIGSEIKKDLESLYNIKVTVINDGNAMIIGECFKGRGVGFKNIIGITIGTGVGGGIIVNDKILLGFNGIAGEIGHSSILFNGILCACGNRGCYEKYASMSALIKMVEKEFDVINIKNFSKENINGKNIFLELKIGNNKLKKIVDEWIKLVGIGLVNFIHVFNPELILIGGGVSMQEEYFIKPLREYIKLNVMERFSDNLSIEGAKLKNTAGVIGAAYYNMKN